jgi:hypothetical protein
MVSVSRMRGRYGRAVLLALHPGGWSAARTLAQQTGSTGQKHPRPNLTGNSTAPREKSRLAPVKVPKLAVYSEHPRWKQGIFSTSEPMFHAVCAFHGIPRDEYQTVPGFYDQTLPQLGATGAPTDIAFAYIDCDMYSSTMSVLEFLLPRLKHGMIIAFDDYFCWSATQLSGERRAQLEFFSRHPRAGALHSVWMARAVLRRRRPENPGHLRVGSAKDIWPHSAHL